MANAEVLFAGLLSLAIVAFHLMRVAHAGGLWRDEAATANLALDFSVRDALANSQHELFPVLTPAAIRGYCLVAGKGDLALRVFGMLVGISTLGALWWNMGAVRQRAPILSLVLLGFNGAFVQWEDSLRAYGLGILSVLLTVGLLWRFLERPNAWRAGAAALAAIASVQCLFNNSILVFGLCMGAILVTLSRGALRHMTLAFAIGLAAAASLVPYWMPLLSVHQWDDLVRIPLTAGDFWLRLYAALSASGWSNGCVWMVLFLAALGVSLGSRLQRPRPKLAVGEQELLLFCGISLAVGAAGYLLFLKHISYTTPVWYFLALMAFTATLLDFSYDVFARQGWLRVARLLLALAVAITSFPQAWGQAQVPQSNVDLVAAELEKAGARQDLIVVVPWYYGVSFNRYYKGETPWMTVPPLAAHDVHRYDLIKSQMMLPDQDQPVKPLLENIRQTLATGHRVWLVGALPLASASAAAPNPGPAPDAIWGWSSAAYSKMWSAKVGALLRLGAKHSQAVQMGEHRIVSPTEEFGLMVFEGWSQP